MTEYVVSRPDLKDGDRNYHYGDRFDRCAWVDKHGDNLVQQLQLQGYFVEATRDAVHTQLTRRPADAPWPPHGFTDAYLAEAHDYRRPGKVKKEVAPAADNSDTAHVTTITLPPDAIPVGRYFMVKRKSGVGFMFDVADATGALLRDKAIRKEADARAFLEDLEAKAASTDSGPADTSGSTESGGGDDDGDV